MSISLSILMLTLTVNVSARPIHVPATAFSVPAPGIQTEVYLIGVISPGCVRVFVIITDEIQNDRYIIAMGAVNIGDCGDQGIHNSPDSPGDLREVIDKPEVQRALDDWYNEYMRNNPR